MRTFFPDYTGFKDLLATSKLLPVCCEVVADLDTPLTLFAKVVGEQDHLFLFESMEGGEKWGRYSFIGYDPLMTFQSKGEDISIVDHRSGDAIPLTSSGNPLMAIKHMLHSLQAASPVGLPPFSGGAVGFMGYEMVRFMENLPDEREAVATPDSSLMVPRIVLAHDSLRQTVTIVSWVVVDDSGRAGEKYEQACQDLEEIAGKIQGSVPADFFAATDTGCQPHEFQSNVSRDAFCQMVERAKEYIYSGDIIQIVLSQRFETHTVIDPLVLYRALRHINPSPYLFYLQLGDVVQIGSSPEILVKKHGQTVDLRPIAGTRKRGGTVTEDQALERELLADPKERAEHLMLVDLGRNDLGRIAKAGTVSVDDLLLVERYSHVMHLVSSVQGKIAEDKDQFDLLSACFPAGTVSGAPKIRAMEIIDELESEKRGAYAGSVGYFGFSGNMDFCITIRTFVLHGGVLWIQAGAGIVADSVPELEYEETINKSMALRRAIELVEEGF
ncbi:anthranilate synthase component I [Desulfotalea psychrophila]|uniref:Anthranilate synthase component 1 n=1 Tax=Desulfotalea psychrophila (strain LSv54 / DSM 12343) TaxID=177439 RepID=Q6AMS7_DESPS|nr:anthranilate synthase component I [Desulfotalea psychrophila]CAG36348.1 probable anthranilate synthase, component I [Desulfotalea psychrophila LSv54]